MILLHMALSSFHKGWIEAIFYGCPAVRLVKLSKINKAHKLLIYLL